MTSYKISKILVPVDLSDTSLNALNTAAHLAKKHGASIQVLNVEEPLFSFSETDKEKHSTYRASPDVMTALIGTLYRATGVLPELQFKEGGVVDSIITTAINGDFDLIVMGTYGASGFREGFIGSNTYNVIKYSGCPILTIPGRQQFTSFKRALFPVRPIAGALKRLDVACHFLAANAVIEVLGLIYQESERVNGVLDKIVGEVNDQLEENKLRVTITWGTSGIIVEDILRSVQKTRPDMIIVTSGIEAISKSNYIGPHVQKLINNSGTPLLIVKRAGIPVLV
jgi:nucleotide-binding universal stress UspA family protein